MTTPLDTLHHTALQVPDIAQAVAWYTEHFNCEIEYQDASWAMLKFANVSLAFVLPEQHPYHVAVVTETPEKYGTPKKHRDGTSSVYIKDPFGHDVELLKLADK